MIEQQPSLTTGFILEDAQVLIAVPDTVQGRDITRYFVSEEAADQARLPDVTKEALQVIGAWRDFDWEEMEEALDRIRHESVPTPPIDL
jgi:hypothetical protein